MPDVYIPATEPNGIGHCRAGYFSNTYSWLRNTGQKHRTWSSAMMS
jgi:hypothetical protein